MALLELIVAITLAGEVRHVESVPGSEFAETGYQRTSTADVQKDIAPPLNLKPCNDYRISPIDNSHLNCSGQSMYEHTINESAGTTGNPGDSRSYLKEVGQTIGCPYYQFAQYLTYCRPDKRQSAWKRIIKERSLFFDMKSVRQFEAVSRKYAFL